MLNFFVGRTEEKKILLKALNSPQGELVAVPPISRYILWLLG